MAGLRKTITASVLFTVFGGPGILLVLLPWLLTRFRVHGAVAPWEAFLLKSWSIGIEAAIVAASVEIFVRFYEEATLTRTFGEEYRLYCEHVPRWIPRLRPWSGSSR